MAPVVVYSTAYCGYCVRARALLTQLGVEFETIDVTDDDEQRRWLVDVTKQRTVPQIFIGGESVGGFDDLAALHRRGQLLPKIEQARH
mgnify:CR=1 FL=1